MTRPRPVPSRPALLGAAVVAVLLALLAIASAASAKGTPQFHRGHLPAIGEIKLVVDAWAPGPGGTSFAAPRVSAHAAALFFHHPAWTVAQVRAALVARSH